MTSIEEIRAGILEKSIEREMAIKKIWADIQKKREEMKKGIKKMKKAHVPTLIMPRKRKKRKVVKKKVSPKVILRKKPDLKDELLDVLDNKKHRTVNFLAEKLGKPQEAIELILQELEEENKVMERVVEASGTEISLWLKKI